jgi:hypothetical protein
MSLTVAAVQVPYGRLSYHKGTLDRSSFSSNISGTTTKSAFQFPIDLPIATSAKHTRWSQSSDHSEGKAEDKQMSNDGSAPRPPHDQNRQYHAIRVSQAPQEHVLPPIISPSTYPIMDGQSKHSPTQSPNLRLAEAADHASEQRGPRLFGVQSILNPSHDEEEARHFRRRGASEMAEDQRATFTPPVAAAAPVRALSGAGTSLAGTSPPLQGGQMAYRRILTPISPRIQRATSYQHRTPGTIDATQRPFLPDVSRRATPEHASSNALPHLSMQTSHVTQHSPFIVPAAPTPPLIQPHRRASVSVVGSTRPSPSPSYADSYSQSGMSGQTSPSMHPVPGAPPGPTPPSSMRLTRSPSLGPMSAVPPGSLDNERGFHGPVVSSGQNYQMLTVDTSKGHMQLPVEVQAASRMADEKRKRNAGASARFRARRKEKEREAASKISNLELELVYALEDSRHYKAERDYLADNILKYVPQYDSHLKNRPPSPRHKRIHLPRPAPPSIDSPLSTNGSERYDSPELERPVTRRRTETYTHPNAPPQLQYPPSPYNQYPPGHAQLPPPQQHPPAQYAQSSAHTHGPPGPLLTRAPAPHEMHRTEQAYDRSNWAPRTNESQR